MTIKVIEPFSENDKVAILEFCKQIAAEKREVDDVYSGFSHEEALALILPGVDFQVDEAEFILSSARGELPDHEIGKDGERVNILY